MARLGGAGFGEVRWGKDFVVGRGGARYGEARYGKDIEVTNATETT